MKNNTKICPECNGNGFVDVTIFDTLAAGLPDHPREVKAMRKLQLKWRGER